MRILFYGVGPLGSLFAVRLAEAGHEVVALARGQRLDDIREHGIVVINDQTEEREVAHVEVVESLEPHDVYDLIMVVMRKNQAMQILPDLAANEMTPTVLFMMNNAGGQQELVDALGAERVMIGFPMPGGKREGHAMRVIPAEGDPTWELPIGEVDGRITARTRRVAAMLESMRGFKAEIRTDMDAWLKYHVAVVGPLAAAMVAADTDLDRFVETRDAIVMGVRGIKEALRGLRELGVPPTPGAMRLIEMIPEPNMVMILRKLAGIEFLRPSLEGHPQAAPDEMEYLQEELIGVLRDGGVETPELDRLLTYFDPETPRIPPGRAEMPMDWRAFWMIGLAKLAVILAAVFGIRWLLRERGRAT